MAPLASLYPDGGAFEMGESYLFARNAVGLFLTENIFNYRDTFNDLAAILVTSLHLTATSFNRCITVSFIQ